MGENRYSRRKHQGWLAAACGSHNNVPCLLIHGFNCHLLTSQSNGMYYSRVKVNEISASKGALCNMRNTAASQATCSREEKTQAKGRWAVHWLKSSLTNLLFTYRLFRDPLLLIGSKEGWRLEIPNGIYYAIGLCIQVVIKGFLHQKFASKPPRLNTVLTWP